MKTQFVRKHKILNLLKTFLVIVNLINIIEGQDIQIPTTPCKRVFNYKVRNSTNLKEVYGYLKFENDFTGDYQLEIRMSLPKMIQTNIRILRLPTEDSIQCGHDLEYEIKFPPRYGLIPVLRFVKFNNKIYCTGSQDISHKVTTQFQEFDGLVTDISDQDDCAQKETIRQNTNVDSERLTANVSTMATTTTPSIIRHKNQEHNNCGILEDSIVGNASGRVHFPWLATIYHSDSEGSKYRCNGALISKKHVVTLALCITGIKTVDLVSIRLGTNNIKEIVPSRTTTVRKAIKLTVHPEYAKSSLDKSRIGNNIGIIELDEPVEYHNLIKPICLWTGSDILKDVVGKQSVVIGFGVDAKPKKFLMPIVSSDVCVRSHKAFADFLDEKSFCAGNRDGVVPCLGNAGGSLMIKGNTSRYYLRGLTTMGIVSSDNNCDGNQYVMFTDVAKYESWIHEIYSE